ncbi:MAG: DUF2764 family protein [Treponematales bacterium]
MSYYYLAAQLPYLIYGQSVPMSSEAFAGLASTALSPEDAALLVACSLDPDPAASSSAGGKPAYAEEAAPSGCGFLDNWREWERALRLNMARFRLQRTKREGANLADAPAHPSDAVAAAKAASAIESPLEAEIFLDKARWGAIENLQGIQYFHRNTIYAYLLKLRLMERRLQFRTEEGFAEYKGLYAAIMSAAEGQSGVSNDRN